MEERALSLAKISQPRARPFIAVKCFTRIENVRADVAERHMFAKNHFNVSSTAEPNSLEY